MKSILFVLSLLPFFANSQTLPDSIIQKKLLIYKNMLDDSLIRQDEYIKLKSKLLFSEIEKPEVKKKKQISQVELKKIYLAETISSPFMIGAGVSLIAIGNYRNKSFPTSAVNQSLAMYIGGGTISGIGIALFVLGLHDRHVYFRNKKANLSLSTSCLGITFRFN